MQTGPPGVVALKGPAWTEPQAPPGVESLLHTLAGPHPLEQMPTAGDRVRWVSLEPWINRFL